MFGAEAVRVGDRGERHADEADSNAELVWEVQRLGIGRAELFAVGSSGVLDQQRLSDLN